MRNTQILQEEVSHWISLEQEGTNLQKNASFVSWLNKDEKNKLAFDEEKNFLKELHTFPSSFAEELKRDIEEGKEIESKRNTFVLSFVSIASAACILLVMYFSFFTKDIVFSKNYIALDKVRANIVLPDNSMITLDANTSLKVEFYDNKREVFLSKGKAFFEIAPNKKRPFIVRTDYIDVKVLGTKFEVINEKDFKVNVKEGKVRVSNKNDKLLALLIKEQSLTLDDNLDVSSIVNASYDDIALWTNGEFNFKQVSLKKVIEEFSKYENIKVVIEDNNLKELPISGKFSVKEFDKLLSSLPLIHPIEIAKEKDTILIMRKK